MERAKKKEYSQLINTSIIYLPTNRKSEYQMHINTNILYTKYA